MESLRGSHDDVFAPAVDKGALDEALGLDSETEQGVPCLTSHVHRGLLFAHPDEEAFLVLVALLIADGAHHILVIVGMQELYVSFGTGSPGGLLLRTLVIVGLIVAALIRGARTLTFL